MTRPRRLQLGWGDSEGRTCLMVRGWTGVELRELRGLPSAQLSRRLALLPSLLAEVSVDARSLQPLAGRFVIEEDVVCFIPRFPFLEGIRYSLLVCADRDHKSREDIEVWTIQRPDIAGPSTTDVVAIYPSADQVPVNLLKLFIHFSGPMSEGWAARAVHVRRADNGQPLEGVFLTEPELWDQDRRRLTLLLDPGRIKRGLVPNAEAGYPLIEGVPFVVTIDALFRDAAGRPLRTGAERRYEVGAPVRARLAPTGWQYHYPEAVSQEPLIVEFDRPLDHALLNHSLWVYDAAGVPLVGQAFVGQGERCWCFQPQSPWEEGRYVLVVDPRLEDLAGNSVVRVFDRDLMRCEDMPAEANRVDIEFICTQEQRAVK